ncbi:toxin-antitoxin system HicB family antitoxin [Nonomuraea sp. NPDC049158]|uniref:toxin-antitoxin system HicB family antitoxin n=1 Tax=Nonomuraea sp. NPDC049158 TaxID=3155649 RepID=UPI0033EF3C02
MDLAPYVDHLRRELANTARAGDDDARAIAERLAAALEPATRLALLEALSAAADEITRDLAPGSVEVRLRGREPGFIVTPPPAGQSSGDAGETGPVRAADPGVRADEGGTSRISLRVPDHLKPRIEEAAAADGLSVNTWLVRALSAALERDGSRHRGSQTVRSHTGWVR